MVYRFSLVLRTTCFIIILLPSFMINTFRRCVATAFTRHVAAVDLCGTKCYHHHHQQQLSTAFSSSSSSSSSSGGMEKAGDGYEEKSTSQSTSPNDYDLNRPYFPIYYNDVYEVDLPPGHRFPMDKYRRVREMVQKKVSEFSAEEQNIVQSGRCVRV